MTDNIDVPYATIEKIETKEVNTLEKVNTPQTIDFSNLYLAYREPEYTLLLTPDYYWKMFGFGIKCPTADEVWRLAGTTPLHLQTVAGRQEWWDWKNIHFEWTRNYTHYREITYFRFLAPREGQVRSEVQQMKTQSTSNFNSAYNGPSISTNLLLSIFANIQVPINRTTYHLISQVKASLLTTHDIRPVTAWHTADFMGFNTFCNEVKNGLIQLDSVYPVIISCFGKHATIAQDCEYWQWWLDWYVGHFGTSKRVKFICMDHDQLNTASTPFVADPRAGNPSAIPPNLFIADLLRAMDVESRKMVMLNDPQHWVGYDTGALNIYYDSTALIPHYDWVNHLLDYFSMPKDLDQIFSGGYSHPENFAICLQMVQYMSWERLNQQFRSNIYYEPLDWQQLLNIAYNQEFWNLPANISVLCTAHYCPFIVLESWFLSKPLFSWIAPSQQLVDHKILHFDGNNNIPPVVTEDIDEYTDLQYVDDYMSVPMYGKYRLPTPSQFVGVFVVKKKVLNPITGGTDFYYVSRMTPLVANQGNLDILLPLMAPVDPRFEVGHDPLLNVDQWWELRLMWDTLGQVNAQPRCRPQDVVSTRHQAGVIRARATGFGNSFHVHSK